MTEVEKISRGLTEAKSQGMLQAREDWFAGHDVGLRNGNTLSVLADKGLLDRRSDPTVWGRSQYRLTPLGLAIRQYLQEQSQ